MLQLIDNPFLLNNSTINVKIIIKPFFYSYFKMKQTLYITVVTGSNGWTYNPNTQKYIN